MCAQRLFLEQTHSEEWATVAGEWWEFISRVSASERVKNRAGLGRTALRRHLLTGQNFWQIGFSVPFSPSRVRRHGLPSLYDEQHPLSLRQFSINRDWSTAAANLFTPQLKMPATRIGETPAPAQHIGKGEGDGKCAEGRYDLQRPASGLLAATHTFTRPGLC